MNDYQGVIELAYGQTSGQAPNLTPLLLPTGLQGKATTSLEGLAQLNI